MSVVVAVQNILHFWNNSIEKVTRLRKNTSDEVFIDVEQRAKNTAQS